MHDLGSVNVMLSYRDRGNILRISACYGGGGGGWHCYNL